MGSLRLPVAVGLVVLGLAGAAFPQGAAAPATYIDCTVDVIQVKLAEGGSGGVTEREILDFGATLEEKLKGLSSRGEPRVLARFHSGLTEENPAVLEALRKVFVVTPVSFEDKEYRRFSMQEIGSTVTLSGVQAGGSGEYAVTLDAQASSVIGWMKDGNPVILSTSITGTRLMQAGSSKVFTTLLVADEKELGRDPLRDFESQGHTESSSAPVTYQFVIVVTLRR
ncbi:MAG: hypothetical protein V2A58_09865 [Planctomycetota bacterium]